MRLNEIVRLGVSEEKRGVVVLFWGGNVSEVVPGPVTYKQEGNSLRQYQ